MARSSASPSGTVAAFRLPCREIVIVASRELAYLRDKVERHCFTADRRSVCEFIMLHYRLTPIGEL